MKRSVLLSIPEPAVKSTNVTTQKYYGVQTDPDYKDEKGYITRENKASGNFIVVDLDGITDGSRWTASSYSASTLVGLVESCLHNDSPVFEFETLEELFTWLLDNKN